MSGMKVIARIRSDFPEKFGIPRQSGLVPQTRSEIIFEEEYRNPDVLRGIEGFSHLWLIWKFSKAQRETWSPTVRPPRLGGNARMGVFATRSPYRPNPVGLSCVTLEEVRLHTDEGPVLIVGGAGSLYTNHEHTAQVADSPDFPDDWKPLAAAMASALEEIRKRNDVKWTYISPAADFQAAPSRGGSCGRHP